MTTVNSNTKKTNNNYQSSISDMIVTPHGLPFVQVDVMTMISYSFRDMIITDCNEYMREFYDMDWF